MKTLEQLAKVDGRDYKIVVHSENETSPTIESHEELMATMSLKLSMLMEDYAIMQSNNNVRKGIAGEVEIWD